MKIKYVRAFFIALAVVLTTIYVRPQGTKTQVIKDESPWDTYSDTWAATDELGRSLPGYEQTGAKKDDKYVGIFYNTWHHDYMQSALSGDSKAPRNITQLLTANPTDLNNSSNYSSKPAGPWGKFETYHYWGEPLFGYYNLEVDEYVIRKHAQMLSDIGVDTLIIDLTNFWGSGADNSSTSYNWKEICKISDTFLAVRAAGGKTPQFLFLCTWNPDYAAQAVQRLYDDMYSLNKYSDLWFNWEGKPLIMASSKSITDQKILDFFTFRTPRPELDVSPKVNEWPWLQIYPQNPAFTEDNKAEQVTVGVAQNWTNTLSGFATRDANGNFNARGRSYQNGVEPLNTDPSSADYPIKFGYNFQEGLNRALEIDPSFIFITQWNEWLAARFPKALDWDPGSQNVPAGGLFYDAYTAEFSRDIEPSREKGLNDNYYYQLAAAIRTYKGVRKAPAVSKTKAISIDGNFEDWADVNPEFRDDIGDKADRDCIGIGKGLKYINKTGRNDFKLMKVARDDKNVYFYVETVDDISSYTDPNWMRLFIKTNDVDPNWNGYNFIINRTGITDTTTTLEKSTSDWNWTIVSSNIQYKISGNKLELAIPKADLGITKKALNMQFKWNDNMQTQGDALDFYLNGDTAPNGRFNYVFNVK